MMKHAEKPILMVETVLGAARENPRTSASIAAIASVGAIFVLLSSKKVTYRIILRLVAINVGPTRRSSEAKSRADVLVTYCSVCVVHMLTD